MARFWKTVMAPVDSKYANATRKNREYGESASTQKRISRQMDST